MNGRPPASAQPETHNSPKDIPVKAKIAALKSALAFGVAPAMATPLLPDSYTVNTAVIPQLIDFLLDKGVAGLFVGGTTGEGVMLDTEQRRALHATAVQATAGRVPVIVHVGAMRTDTAVDLARHAADIGADAVAVVTPFFYKLNDDALFTHYAAVARAVPDLPMFAYDIPQLALNSVSPALTRRLVAELPNMAGMKTSTPDAQAVRALIHATPADKIVLIGNEGVLLGTLALGADGAISGLATAIPEPFVALGAALRRSDLPAAQRLQRQINELLVATDGGARLGAIKLLLQARGIPIGPTVPTLPMPTANPWPAVEAILNA